MTDHKLALTLLEPELAVVRVDRAAKTLAAAVTAEALERDEFFTLSRNKDETSLIVEYKDANNVLDTVVKRRADTDDDAAVQKVEGGWRGFKAEGPFEFDVVGVVSNLAAPLAAHKIPVFVVSTYDTDYLLIKADTLQATIDALRGAGCTIHAGDSAGAASTSSPVEAADSPEASDLALRPFSLERYFALYEFSAPHLLCCSDCESLSMREVLDMADDECKELWDKLSLGYTESSGLPQLREEIARLYTMESPSSWQPAADNAIVLCPEEGIFLAAQALLKKGDHVVVPNLCYQSLTEVARSIGCTMTCWEPTIDDSGRWSFPVDSLRGLVTDRTRLVVVNFPHNPTGATLAADEWDALLEICRAKNAYLFSDEMYQGLEIGAAALPAAFLRYDKAVSLSGVSKSLSMPGARIGWLASQDTTFLNKVQTLKDYTTICPPAPSEILALIALRNREAIIARNMKIIQAGLSAMRDFFAQYSKEFDFAPPEAGTIAFPRLRPGSALAKRFPTTLALSQALVKNAGIMMLPSSVYNLDEDPNCVRLGFGRKNVPDILARLGPWLEAQLQH